MLAVLSSRFSVTAAPSCVRGTAHRALPAPTVRTASLTWAHRACFVSTWRTHQQLPRSLYHAFIWRCLFQYSDAPNILKLSLSASLSCLNFQFIFASCVCDLLRLCYIASAKLFQCIHPYSDAWSILTYSLLSIEMYLWDVLKWTIIPFYLMTWLPNSHFLIVLIMVWLKNLYSGCECKRSIFEMFSRR